MYISYMLLNYVLDHSLLHPASLNDGLIRRDLRFPYDLLMAIPHWAQLPEGVQILSQV